MARNLANAVANARPARAASGVGPAKVVPGGGASHIGGAKAVAPPAAKAPNKRQAPAAPAPTPPPAGMPWDAQAQQEAGEAFTEEANSLSELGANWTGRETYYGFGENGANNPYSQAAMLAKHHEWNERGRSNASGLQAFAGSNVNAEREEIGRYTTSYAQLLQAYEAERASKEAQEESAKNRYAAALQGAQLGAIQRASEVPPEPAAPTGSSYKPGSSGNKKNTKKSAVYNNRKA